MRHTPVIHATPTVKVHIIEASPHTKSGYIPMHPASYYA